jgi:hypothetical protein
MNPIPGPAQEPGGPPSPGPLDGFVSPADEMAQYHKNLMDEMAAHARPPAPGFPDPTDCFRSLAENMATYIDLTKSAGSGTGTYLPEDPGVPAVDEPALTPSAAQFLPPGETHETTGDETALILERIRFKLLQLNDELHRGIEVNIPVHKEGPIDGEGAWHNEELEKLFEEFRREDNWEFFMDKLEKAIEDEGEWRELLYWALHSNDGAPVEQIPNGPQGPTSENTPPPGLVDTPSRGQPYREPQLPPKRGGGGGGCGRPSIFYRPKISRGGFRISRQRASNCPGKGNCQECSFFDGDGSKCALKADDNDGGGES